MTEAKMKGSAIVSGLGWMREQLGPDAMERVYARYSGHERDVLRWAVPMEWYPLEYSGRTEAYFVEEAGVSRDRAASEQLMREQGRHVAADNLTHLYPHLLSGVDPASLIRQMGVVWDTYLRGVALTIEVGDRAATIAARGADSDYLSPIACGWLTYALERVGARAVRVSERSWATGAVASPEFVFDASWL